VPDPSKHRLMVVEDDSTSRQSITAFLHANGYEVTSATDGYDALWQLKNGMVDVMISDLEMPGLSGAEFLSVIRQQYPKMLLIAMTVKAEGQSEPPTAMADAFYPKGQQHPKKLLSTIAELLRDSAVRRTGLEVESSEISATGYRSNGVGIPPALLTCPECLKSLSNAAPKKSLLRESQEVPCIVCGNTLGYVGDLSYSATSVGHTGSSKRLHRFGLGNSCTTTWRFARLVQRKFREMLCGLANKRLLGESSAYPSGNLRDHDDTTPLKVTTQTSRALHGEGRAQERKTDH